jgi:hypothetical protein
VSQWLPYASKEAVDSKSHFEKVRPGLAEFTRDAFRANAERAAAR